MAPLIVNPKQMLFNMTINSSEKRRSAAGINALSIPNVTPNADHDDAWRLQVAGVYSGLIIEDQTELNIESPIDGIYNRLGLVKRSGTNSLTTAVELNGGSIIEYCAGEPDPVTHRGDFYYNTTNNILYSKIVAENKPRKGKIVSYWKRIS